MSNVIPFHETALKLTFVLAALPMAEVALTVCVPPELARSIRFTAGMHGKPPQDFLLDWLKSGFPENAA